ncbi:hypothetical protein SAMN02746095_01862 [Acidocella aminolytica 101 = DSM 11237]|nr:hypothetical protein SAMN02746095_01862 [Acidocella aminolytica 101 = DSM 11237]
MAGRGGLRSDRHRHRLDRSEAQRARPTLGTKIQGEVSTEDRVATYSGRVNSARNISSDRFRPSSVRTSDLALFTGSAISPFS